MNQQGAMEAAQTQERSQQKTKSAVRGIIPLLARPVRRLLPGPYHRLRMVRHHVRMVQFKRILRVITAEHGLVVQGGPFAGMVFVPHVIDSALAAPRALGSALLPKLLGCYEAELHGILDQVIKTGYQEIVDIGCAEGCYAVGLALRLPSARVYAFDIDPLRRQLCEEMARANSVADRIIIAGACDEEQLAVLSAQQPLIICDCEGCEMELLRPDVVPGLSMCDVLVELHDFVDPAISATILARFAATHDITFINGEENDPAAYPVLASLSTNDQRFAVGEERTEMMQWAFMKAKKTPGKQ